MTEAITGAFKDRSVFVTGHTGFKGSWLCLWLHRLGAKVTGYSLEPPTQPNNFTVSGIQSLLERHYEADIRDEETMHAALRDAAPDVVLHLAAQSVVSTGYESPRETFDTNVVGVASVLDGVAKLDRDCAVVVVTTDKCYENREQVWGYRECDPLGADDPYSASKSGSEIVVRSYLRSFFPPERISEHGIRLASARAGNVIGGGDWTTNGLLIDMVNAFSSGRQLEVRAPGACRPWQHVLDCLGGYLTLAARLGGPDAERFCDGWNIGPTPGSELTVREIVELFIKEWGSGSWKDVSDQKPFKESEILRLSIDKAIWELGWSPTWDVEETFHHAAEWYRAYQAESVSMREIGLQQIAKFENDMIANWNQR